MRLMNTPVWKRPTVSRRLRSSSVVASGFLRTTTCVCVCVCMCVCVCVRVRVCVCVCVPARARV
jgi:hypothetical protein